MHENKKTIEVDAERFKEIEESYSGDRLSEKNTLRRPFKFQGSFFVAIGGISGGNSIPQEECYQIVPRHQFAGQAKWYGEKLENVPVSDEEAKWGDGWAEQRRSQAEGFYHGMLAKRGGSEWVLVGPPLVFQQKEGSVDSKQLELL